MDPQFITQSLCHKIWNKQIVRGLRREQPQIPPFNVRTNDLSAQLEKNKNVTSPLFADDVAIWLSLPNVRNTNSDK
jgi:hypothetical protein